MCRPINEAQETQTMKNSTLTLHGYSYPKLKSADQIINKFISSLQWMYQM